MASGLGHMLGFYFPDNFRYPYISKSITEFWRSDGIFPWAPGLKSMSTFPWEATEREVCLQIRNILIVWLLTGIWHGASIKFPVMGYLFRNCLLLLEKFVLMKYLKQLPSLLQCAYAFLLVLLGWVLFAFEDMGQGFQYLPDDRSRRALPL